MTFTPLRLLALLFASLLVLSACGDDDDSSSSTTSTTAESDTDDSDNESTSTTESDSDDDTTFNRDEYVDALEAEFQDVTGTVEDDGPRCIANALVDAVGIDHLEAEGISVSDFTEAGTLTSLGVDLDESDIDAMAASIDDCIDLIQVMAATAPSGFACLLDTVESRELSRAFAEDLALGTGFDPSAVMFESASPECAEQVFLSTAVAQGDIDQSQADCVADNLDDDVSYRLLNNAGQSPDPSDGQALEAAFEACGVSP